MNLFRKYNLWSFLSVMLFYLLKDFQKSLSSLYNKKISLSILKDHEHKINKIKKTDWILLKNNIKNTTAGKLRFLISENEYSNLKNQFEESAILSCFSSIAKKLTKITMIDEIENFTSSKLHDPSELGNPEKYFALHIAIRTDKKEFVLLFVIRGEMMLFPPGKISSNFILALKPKHFKKAFIELDKKIIWHGMKNWGDELQKRMQAYITGYPVEKPGLYASNDNFAYRLFLQYLYLIKLID